MSSQKTPRPQDDYDSPWKEALDHLFAPFLAFFLPQSVDDIDWTCSFQALDQDLQKVVRGATS